MLQIIKTRFPNLGYALEAKSQWSFYDIENRASIGCKYRTLTELLHDAFRFANERGYI
jgi:hypothetical protein